MARYSYDESLVAATHDARGNICFTKVDSGYMVGHGEIISDEVLNTILSENPHDLIPMRFHLHVAYSNKMTDLMSEKPWTEVLFHDKSLHERNLIIGYSERINGSRFEAHSVDK